MTDDRYEDFDDEQTPVTVEITGLSLYARQGNTAAEREVGQRILLDLRFDIDSGGATLTDRPEDTIDYQRVCELAALTAQKRSYATLEALCATVGDYLLQEFSTSEVWVKATRPDPPLQLPVESISIELCRSSDED